VLEEGTIVLKNFHRAINLFIVAGPIDSTTNQIGLDPVNRELTAITPDTRTFYFNFIPASL